QPQLILALGRFAAHSLLGSQAPISQLRGQVHEFAGIPVIVSYHPAYLLRNPADKARVWRDLCFARDLADAAAAKPAETQSESE
ncbi:MAG: uracil-DNA glycosylase, partial [Betaproteobacteria bacterium]|nr:uracil-DNA glycosylase [Betaproteobacteria bacterium]